MPKTRIIEDDENYAAKVVKLTTIQTLEGLDNLRGTYIDGNLVLIGKEHWIDELGVFFPAEAQLSAKFCSDNNLFKDPQSNEDKTVKGYIEANCRVKALKLRGHVSTGLWLPFSALAKAIGWQEGELKQELPLHSTFHYLNDVEICRKYRRPSISKTPGLRNIPKVKTVRDRVDERMFAQHTRTGHLFSSLHTFGPDDMIRISRKLHGTSARVGLVRVHKPWTLWKRLLRKLRIEQQMHEWKFVVGSRQVIKQVEGEQRNPNHWYRTDVWTDSAERFREKLHKGEVIYYEIIGWAGTSPIQKGYTYGIPCGSHEIYVYRITHTNEDGVAHDLALPALQARCEQLGVKLVPQVYYGRAGGFPYYKDDLSPFVEDEWRSQFTGIIQKAFLDKPSILDPKVVEEGLVITIESLGVFHNLKAKSPLFILHETKVHDSDDTTAIGDDDGVREATDNPPVTN